MKVCRYAECGGCWRSSGGEEDDVALGETLDIYTLSGPAMNSMRHVSRHPIIAQ